MLVEIVVTCGLPCLVRSCVCVCVYSVCLVEDKPEEITISNNNQTLPNIVSLFVIQRKTPEF